MGDYSEWLLKLEERVGMLRGAIWYIYLTKMSIAWMLAFFTLAVISYNEIANLYVAYIILGFSVIVGIAIAILMILRMTSEVSEVKTLRSLYAGLVESCENGHNLWDPDTIIAFKNFQGLFKRICPGVSIDDSRWPQEEPLQSTNDMQKTIQEERRKRGLEKIQDEP